MVRRGWTPVAFRIRIASSITDITDTPLALSVAPVPVCQESRRAPIATTSSAKSLPRISATTLYPVGSTSLMATRTSTSMVTGTPRSRIR